MVIKLLLQDGDDDIDVGEYEANVAPRKDDIIIMLNGDELKWWDVQRISWIIKKGSVFGIAATVTETVGRGVR